MENNKHLKSGNLYRGLLDGQEENPVESHTEPQRLTQGEGIIWLVLAVLCVFALCTTA